MRYISFVYIMLMIAYSSHIYGQIKSITSCEVENITFKAEVINYDDLISGDTSLYYRKGDTVDIEYSVINNSDKPIYIFDPDGTPSYGAREPEWDSCLCRYIYFLGGSFYYKPGFYPYLKLIQLDPLKTYKYSFKYVLLGDKYSNNCVFGISSSRNRKNQRTNLVLFDIGYIFKSDQIEFTEKDKDGYMGFSDMKSGIYFDSNLRRFYLGPLMFNIRK